MSVPKLQKPENGLRAIFWLFTVFCLAAAAAAPDRGSMVSGLLRICTQPVHTLVNFFAADYGGYAGAWLNTGLVALVCVLLFHLPGVSLNDGSVVAFFLTAGLTARGITILNFLQGIPGVLIFCLVNKKRPGTQVNAMVFTSGVSLLFTELLHRYPGDTWQDPTLLSASLALAVGCVSGYLVALVLSWNLQWQGMMSLYSAALPVGLLSILLNTVFYMLPRISWPEPTVQTGGNDWLMSNLFLIIFFLLCILLGFTILGGSPGGYVRLMKDKLWNVDYSREYGPGNVAVNLGCLGLLSVLYYNLAGVPWTSVAMGSVLCMACTCCRGTKPANAWPILLGYMVTSCTAYGLCWVIGTPDALTASTPSLITGASFAVGLCPIVNRHGRVAGFAAGVMHYCLVINVLPVIGEFCMYHGGYTAALVSFLLVPVLERFRRTRLTSANE